jgi:uncharacterized membrane protein
MKRESLPRTLYGYLKAHKKFWLVPLIVFCCLLVLLLLLVETAPVVAPFIYTLF